MAVGMTTDRSGTLLVTIVIPTLNRASLLERAIGSALAQTHDPIEVLVVDNASDDETAVVARSFADPRLQYHRQPARVGIEQNHRTGLDLARGEFVVFLSDDDLLRQDFVANRMATLARHPGAVVAFSGYERCNDRFEITGRVAPRLPEDVPLPQARLLKAAIRRRFTILSSLYARRMLVEIWPAVAGCGDAFDTGLQLLIALRYPAGAVYMPWSDIVYTRHARQTSTAERHFEQGCRMYRHTLQSPMPGWAARRIRHNFAIWVVNRGRYLAAQGNVVAARDMFREAIRTYPLARAGWMDLAKSFVAPSRLRAPW